MAYLRSGLDSSVDVPYEVPVACQWDQKGCCQQPLLDLGSGLCNNIAQFFHDACDRLRVSTYNTLVQIWRDDLSPNDSDGH